MESWVLVILGGALGAAMRYGLQLVLPASAGGISIGVLLSNLAGCFLAGMLLPVVLRNIQLQALLMTGFLGAFTTLSAFAADSHGLISQQRYSQFFLYWLATSGGGVLLFLSGAGLGRRLSSILNALERL